LPTEVPCVTLVDDQGTLTRAIIDDRTVTEVRRCRTMWNSLQELGGIHNSHAERLLAKERETQAAVPAAPVLFAEAPASTPAVAAEAAPTIEATEAEPAVAESHGDDPYIETPRCTSCNECTNVNNKMFAYDDNKQAYIADPDAGTFRQLVEAAEGCQVSIIHPGKPRNPKEPGLEDLIKRAAEFN
jgi:ferredoxin